MPSCIVATHSDGCRERLERLMMQDPVGADRVVRTKHVTMKHSQDTWKKTMKEREDDRKTQYRFSRDDQ